MKKGWKVFWVLCISMGVLGIALCISGMLLGATAQSVREAFGLHQLQVMEEVIDSSFEHSFDGGYSGSSSGAPYSQNYDGVEYAEAYDEGENSWEQYFSQIEELKIDVTCLEVEIYEGEVYEGNHSDITVDTSSVEQEFLDDLVITQKDKELKIEVKNRNKWDKLGNNGYRSRGTLLIQIPAGQWFEEASVKVGAGVLRVSEIAAKELDIEVGAGQVDLNVFKAGELELECGAGEATLYGEVESEIKIECGVGQVTYTAAGSQEDYDYEVSCGIGSVTVGDDSYSGLGGKRKVNNGGSKKMEIECGIGEVYVSFAGGEMSW